jgi:hypothetical protein
LPLQIIPMNFNKGHNMRLYLSPDADGGGGNQGGAGDAGAPAGAPAGGDGGAGSAPQWVSKADFDTFASRLEERFSQVPARNAEPAANKPGEPTEPDPSKYNFGQDPTALSRYNKDLRTYFRHLDKQDAEREKADKAPIESAQKADREHRGRLGEYKKTHPEFASDLQKNGIPPLVGTVQDIIKRHSKSAEITHELIKDRSLADDLNSVADSGDEDAIKFRIGEIVAEIRQKAKALEANTVAAGQRPIPFSNRGSSQGGKAELSAAERVKRYKAAS